MRPITPLVLLCLSPAVCLGVVALTSFIIFYAFRRGGRDIYEHLGDEASSTQDSGDTAVLDASSEPDELSESSNPNTVKEMSACPACGGENPVDASRCDYCGRKL
jgi:hypothetical protein